MREQDRKPPGAPPHRQARPPAPTRFDPAGPLTPQALLHLQRVTDNTTATGLVRARSGNEGDGGAPPATAAVEALVPNVLDVLNRLGVPLRALELRMLDPVSVIMGIVYGAPEPALAGMTSAQVCEWLDRNFVSACGDTANLLRDTTFPAGGAERTQTGLAQVVAELRRPEDANIRINCQGHAFFVERRGGVCRVLQSYIGRYALADSARGSAGATPLPAEQLADRLQAIGDHHLANGSPFQAHPDEEALFGGPLFTPADRDDPGLRLRGESAAGIPSADEQRGRLQTQLTRFAATWNDLSTSTLPPDAWLAARSG